MGVRHLLIGSLVCALSHVNFGEVIHSNTTLESGNKSISCKVLLLLDVSGSLAFKNRKYKLRAAVSHWIENYAPDETVLSMVKFSSQAREIHGPLIVNSTNRKELIHSLPIRSEGRACLRCGIQKAIEVATAGTVIVIMTDGEIHETNGTIQALRKLLKDAHMTTITIIIGDTVKSELQQLGMTYLVQDKNGVPGLISSLQEALYSFSSPISIPAVLLEAELNNTERMARIFQVDSSASTNLCISITSWPDGTDVLLKVTKPDGLIYITDVAGRYYYNCTKDAMVGKWTLDMKTTSKSKAIFMSVLVTAECNQQESAIKFRCAIKNDADPPYIYAILEQGKHPVRGATVVAELWQQNGITTNVTLFYQGIGPNIVNRDNVYLRYIPSSPSQTGWHSALCWATGNITAGNESLQESFIRITRSELTKVKRRSSTYPPLPINDLRVTYMNSSLILSFTSTGSELDWGQALEYHLLMANSTHEIPSAHYKILNTIPKEVHSMERIIVPLPAESCLALRVRGKTGLLSNISSIIEIFSLQHNGKNNASGVTVKVGREESSVSKPENEVYISTYEDNEKKAGLNKTDNVNKRILTTEPEGISPTLIIVIIAVSIILLVIIIILALRQRRNREAKYTIVPKIMKRKKALVT